ncbi:hypothetical protein AB0H73_39075 [Streptomyces olivoreticuli]
MGGPVSAVAAPAAPLKQPLSEFIDKSFDEAPVRLPRQQGGLRSVPAQAGPVPVRGPGRPLALGRDARARLGGVVRALLDAPGLDGATDAVRLATVVLAARTPSASGVVEIRTGELGRWLGLSASYVASEVLPGLRRSGVVAVVTAEGEFGQDNGLECRVLPLWEARGTAGHPLALHRKEFATLLRLLEAVMAPGWAHRDGSVTPAGMLGSRTGRGAATDRLALLLLVLEARETGRVRQCGGAVDTKRGRAAATVARLLGCTASAGERVLERLEDRGLVRRVRLRTASGLAHRTRLMVPAVAAAHGHGVSDVQEDRAAAPEPVFSEPDVAAGAVEASEPDTEPQVSGMPVRSGAEAAEPDVTAALHSDHSPVVTPGGSAELAGGFSGEGRGGNGDLPGRACVREDQAPDAAAVDTLRLVDSEGGPLCGEQPESSPLMSSEKSGRGPVISSPVRAMGVTGQGRQQRGRVPLPPPELRAVLAPVDLVWARLERPAARRLVEAAARGELIRVQGYAGRADAPRVLADRLARRLADQLRLGAPIQDPVAWLLVRGLPQRQECGDARCDDGVLLDSGRGCPRCEDRRVDRRAQRCAVAAAVDAAMPHVSEAERRAATDRELHETVTAQAWAKAREWDQVRERQAAATQAAVAEPAVLVVPIVVLPAPRPAVVAPEPEPMGEDVDQEMVLDWRTRAAKDHQVVLDHIDRYGQQSAQRLFTRAFVAQVQRLSGLGHLDLGYTSWGQA